MSRDATLPPGTPVGELRIVEPVGRGGMGIVYRATQPQLGNAVAVKVLHADRVWDPAAVARFEQEARTVAGLRHPGIVNVFSFGELADGRRYYVMELLAGETLKQRLAAPQRLELAQALRAISEIASALDAAHAQGVIHRDVKPSNIFLQRGAGAKLLDFGVAKLLGDRDSDLTNTDQHPGTPQYMSPEQCRGQALDRRSDIYSLALVAFECMSGVAVFAGLPLGEIAIAQQTAEPPRVSEHVPALEALDAPLRQALHRDPRQRPASATAFARAVAEAANGELDGLAAAADWTLEPPSGGAPYDVPQSTRSVAPTDHAPRRRVRGVLLAAAGVAAVAAAAAAVGALVAVQPLAPLSDAGIGSSSLLPGARRGDGQAGAAPEERVDVALPDASVARGDHDRGVVRRVLSPTRRPRTKPHRRRKRPRPKKIIEDDLIRF